MSSRAAEPPVLIRTRPADSLAWMRLDLTIRVVPFGVVILVHFGATCGFLGPGPWLLRRLRLL